MNKALLRSIMVKRNDTQAVLAEAMGLSLSRLNAKINGAKGADFRQNEIEYIKKRYALSPRDVSDIFFENSVSYKDTKGQAND
ncbi:hypothetical protein [Christensenella minuta]|uniref:hypothetical protein n=1 Tax=Christensenella minuta TaxID=626937 RepID=UPI002158456F|nr:hypothetical protein [Christensenella minuta]